MERTRQFAGVVFLALATLLWSVNVSEAEPLSTAWTYQGRLIDANEAADGLYDMKFKLYDDPNVLSGIQVGSTLDFDAIDVIDGYFVAELDFGIDVFNGDSRWLQINIRKHGDPDPNYIWLTPRQEITASPYAMYAVKSNWNNLINMPSGFADGVDDVGGLTVEVDPVFTASSAYSITGSQITNWTTAYGWGNHASAGYLTAETDPTILDVSIKDGVSWGELSGIPGDIADGDQVGITSETDPQVGSISTGRVPRWNGSALVTGSIFDNGNVGIGTTSPSCPMHVKLSGTGITNGVRLETSQATNEDWYIYMPSTDNLVFRNDVTDCVTFEKDTGNVGIGAAPESNKKLYAYTDSDIYGVYGETRVTSGIQLAVTGYAEGDTTSSSYGVYGGSKSATGSNFGVYGHAGHASTGNNYGVYGYGSNSGTGDSYAGYFSGKGYFSGNVGIGVLVPTSKLHVDGDVRATDDLNAGDDVYIHGIDSGVGLPLSILDHKVVYGVSSMRFKKDIEPLEDDYSKVLQLQPKSFTYKDTDSRTIGYIAEDLQDLGLEHLICYQNGEPFGIYYDKLPVYLLEVIKDQVKETDKLRHENESLKQRVENLESNQSNIRQPNEDISQLQERLMYLEHRLDGLMIEKTQNICMQGGVQ